MPSRVFASLFVDAASKQIHRAGTPSVTVNDAGFAVEIAFQNVVPLDNTLQRAWNDEYDTANAWDLIQDTIARFQQLISGITGSNDDSHAPALRSYAQALFARSVPQERFLSTLSLIFFEIGTSILDISAKSGRRVKGLPDSKPQLEKEFPTLLYNLCDVGLGGDYVSRAYAIALDELLKSVLLSRFGGQAAGGWSRIEAVAYIQNVFAPFAEDFMRPLSMLPPHRVSLESASLLLPVSYQLVSSDAQIWVDRGAEKIASVMSRQLYGLVTSGRLQGDDALAQDLEQITTTPLAREYVALELHRQLGEHLLNSGSSTVSILDAYVQFIWALRRIDQSGILLARISDDIVQYLRSRDDAVRIVILSLLEPGEGPDATPLPSEAYFSGHVSKLMKEAMAANSIYGTTYYPGKDLKSLTWEPEPIDALEDYRATRYRDAMGHMVTIKDKDAFIEELRSILGERLLKSDALQFDQEERLLAMFKTRFEEFPIRECEIMLKDMQESLSWHRYINGKRALSDPNAPELEVKVISHAYWPTLRNESLELPRAMKELMDWYSGEFQEIKYARTLDWLNAQGRVTVELVFEDRVVKEEVTTWQAAVIYQFDDGEPVPIIYNVDNDDSTEDVHQPIPISRSPADIEAAIGLGEDLIRSALTFWIGKLVLQESQTTPDTYIVIERLTNPTISTSSGNAPSTITAETAAAAVAAAAVAQAETVAATADVKSPAELIAENAPLYTNFVVNMLTNQGHMPAGRMMMMLKMLVAGGFPFEEAEFVEFLEGLQVEGKVEKAGGLWMVKKS